MEFEVIAKCNTTRARVSRMKLARRLTIFGFRYCSDLPPADGVTMLPTFMPVATQAAIKGLTPEQVESLGVTLILNNTYHLNLRPGLKVLNEAGGAHKFQGWDRNLLTVCVPLRRCAPTFYPTRYPGQRRFPTSVPEQVYHDHRRGRAILESFQRGTNDVDRT